MTYKFKHQDKQYLVCCDNMRQLYTSVCDVMPELHLYQCYRYSVYPLACDTEIKWIVNLVVRQEVYDALLFEKVHVSSPATNYTRVSPIFDTFEQAVSHYKVMCAEFERHTNIKLQVFDSDDKPRTTKGRKETFSDVQRVGK